MAEILTQDASGKKNLNKIFDDLISPLKTNTIGNKLWIGFLLLIIIAGTIAYALQLMKGLGVTAMRDYSSWGLYISNFVFLVAVSLVGSLVTAILKLSGQKWATPVTRISELVAVAAVAFAGLSIVVDMGRPDRVLNIFFHGRFSSPIIWDITVVNTYLVISLILLYLPLIPDIAILRDRYTDAPKWQQKVYKMLALGWTGNDEQYKLLKKAIRIMLVLIMPVALAIHTVTSWLFAVNNRTGWDSSIFGPYFVAGAFMVGVAAVIIGMYFFRRGQKLEEYISMKHFDMMGKLLVLTSLIYLYFNINEYLVPGYKMKSLDFGHITELFAGHEAPLFYGIQVFGMIIPIFLLIFKKMRTPMPMLLISIVVVIGAFLKRYLIVVPTQFHPTFPIQNVPESFHHYVPTLPEMTITASLIAGVLLIITLFVRLFPIVPIWETAHENGHHNIEEKASKVK
ncbi:MAG: NrfD/PsrC family molybdoenzyme membrane anchor subunit [Bacteroidota bacterium]|nr:NrfD/PsrC family molybdoenzyme membrane anchor subunit [Bacteroidota bacterium]